MAGRPKYLKQLPDGERILVTNPLKTKGSHMARINKRGLFFILIIGVIAVAAGGYFFQKSTTGGASASADSTAADSTLADADSTSSEDDEKKGPDPVPVEISIATPRQISSYYYTTASLEPERKVDLLAKAVGQVTKLLVEEGSLVKTGELLCEIEEGELRVTLTEAKINMEQQKREYERLETM